MKINHRRFETISAVFQERFHTTPSHWSRAPGRVDLMGSHTDYNLGYVLTLPIERDTWIAARPNAASLVRVYSMNLEAENSFPLDQLAPAAQPRWSNYLRGVAAVLKTERLALNGFDAVIHSTVPISAGLSSSAALECATATLFEALGGWNLDPVRKALLCQRAENEFVGVKCGILDQYTSCLGREGCALLLDCRDLSSRPVELAKGIGVVIGDTKSKRELAGSEYGERRAQCEQGARLLGAEALRDVTEEQFEAAKDTLPPVVEKRCRFIIEENARVQGLAHALSVADPAAIRRLTEASFRGACELYEIASTAMRAMIEAMLSSPGVIGARQAGAGFGGCMVAFVETAQLGGFSQAARDHYLRATGIGPEIYPVQAAAGTGLLETLMTGNRTK